MRKVFCIGLLAVLLSACASDPAIPSLPLSERLAGKTLEEKKEILREACLDEARDSTIRRKDRYRGSFMRHRLGTTEETNRLKALCQLIDENYDPNQRKSTISAPDTRE